MFSVVKLKDTIQLKAKQLGDKIHSQIHKSVVNNYEHKINNKINAYIIKIIDIDDDFDNGIVNDIDGSVSYSIIYVAVIFMPIKNHIIDVTIEESNEIGLFGCSKIIPNGPEIEIKFITPKDILIGYNYNNGNWNNAKKKITNNSEIKLKILNYQMDFNKIVVIGTVVD
jgi:DNA-directed RNA polymerase subunit E'/Rpb7